LGIDLLDGVCVADRVGRQHVTHGCARPAGLRGGTEPVSSLVDCRHVVPFVVQRMTFAGGPQ
jgi:hypothetical protein